MPDSFEPLAPAATATAFRTADPAPAARPDLRRFEPVPGRHSFDVTGAAAIPEQLLRAARDQAREAGFAAGHAAGREQARRETAGAVTAARAARDEAAAAAAAEVAFALRAVQTAADRLERQTVALTTQTTDRVLAAVAELTTALLGHALATGADTAFDAVRRALGPVPGNEPVVVALSPADADVVRHALAVGDPAAAVLTGSDREVVVAVDPTLVRGDAVATSGAVEVDARLEVARRRALEALGA